MRLTCGDHAYEWIEGWAKLPGADQTAGWAHPGMAVLRDGTVAVTHPAEPSLLLFDPDGNLKRTIKTGLAEIHGMTAVEEGGTEYLWLADNGSKRDQKLRYGYPPGVEHISGQVVEVSLDGRVVTQLERPDHPAYKETRFAPTSVAVNEVRSGGNGDIWVADGYGASLVHRYDNRGKYLASLSGAEGAGRFNTPHGVYIDQRKPVSELYVADRSNHRIQVYDLSGKFRRCVGEDSLSSPSAFAPAEGLLVVAELRARLAILDANDRLVCYLGDNSQVCDVPGWPNNKDARGNVVPTKLLQPGKFNSPHGLAADPQGNIYVAEWLIGWRTVKLARM